MKQPVSPKRLQQITNDACDSALSTASYYDHAQTQHWNNAIINSILQALISEATSAQPDTKYKFAVNSTIIQHLSDPRSIGSQSAGTQTGPGPAHEGANSAAEELKKVGRRGMHSASGAYWNSEKDGMWSHKYQGGEGKGMDIVVSVMWIAA